MEALKNRLKAQEHLQKIIFHALRVSLEPVSLETQIERILNLVLSTPGLSLEAKGAVFLLDSSGKFLNLTASQGLPPALQIACRRIAMGQCLCGRAAENRKIVFAPDMDEFHEITYDDIHPHGHYCVPILAGDRLLGVINAYVPSGHLQDEMEVVFLEVIASALAGVIDRKRGEMALQDLRDEMNFIVQSQTSKGMFNPFVIDRLLDLWRFSDTPASSFAPDPEQVGKILEVVFQASLRRKEETTVELSVSFFPSRALVGRSKVRLGMPFLFENPLPFRVDSLVALAKSFDPVTTTLGVVPRDDQSGELDIFGAIHFNCESRHRFEAHTFSRFPGDMLTVMVRKAGCLQVFKGSEAIGGFESGLFAEPNPPPFTDSPLAWSLLSVIQKHPEYVHLGMGYWHVYRDFVDRLLLDTVSKRNGGAIIWLPDSHADQAWGQIEHRFTLSHSSEGTALLYQFKRLEDWLNDNRKNPDWHHVKNNHLRLKRELLDFANLLSRMTRVDGALILSDRLRPQAFGTMLNANSWQGEIVSWVDERLFPSVRVDFKKLGARHTSAVNFIGQCPGAVAFVISQDGPVAGLVRKDEKTIYWWPDCLGGLRDS